MGKGILQSIEAVISILMVLSIFAIAFAPRGGAPGSDTDNWKMRGFLALKSLDDSGQLRIHALSNDTLSIKEKLQDLIQPNVNFDVVVCGSTCSIPDIGAERIVSTSYLIAGNESSFSPREIVLYMW